MKDSVCLTHWLTTPLGPLEIGLDVSIPNKPCYQYIAFKTQGALSDPANVAQHELLSLAADQLSQYFLGQRREFTELMPYFHHKGTEFQRRVWRALMEVSYGETRSYAELAKMLNNPKAVRAVGAANGKNSLAIVVPCHRVIGANGTLTGYAGGLDKKKWLLEFENPQSMLRF